MRLKGKLGRRSVLTLAAVAAAAGTGTGMIIPALGATPGSVTVLTLPEGLTVGPLAVVPAPSNVDGDWLFLSSGNVDQLNSDNSFGSVGSNLIAPGAPGAAAVSNGSTDYVDDGSHLLRLAVSSTGALAVATVAATPSITPTAVAVGPEGDVYIANQAGTIMNCALVGSSPCTTVTVPNSFGAGGTSPGHPTALATDANAVWFLTATGDLGSLSPDGTFSGPYDPGDFTSSTNGGMAAQGASLWIIGNISGSFYKIDTTNPNTAKGYSVPAPSTIPGGKSPLLSGVAIGPDNNPWFSDPTNAAVARFDSSGFTEYTVPSGNLVAGPIAAGPAGTDSLVFPLSSGGAPNLVGAIQSSDPIVNGPTTTFANPAPPGTTTSTTTQSTTTAGQSTTTGNGPPAAVKARLSLSSAVPVSTKRVASLKLTCARAPGHSCAGHVTLSLKRVTYVKKRVKGTLKPVKVTVVVALATARYRLASGHSATVRLSLSKAWFAKLEAARGRKLTVTATAKPTAGLSASRSVTLVGPKP